MRFYRLCHGDGAEWHTDKRLAIWRGKQIKKEKGGEPVIFVTDVPTSKKLLRAWLNRHLAGSNGLPI